MVKVGQSLIIFVLGMACSLLESKAFAEISYRNSFNTQYKNNSYFYLDINKQSGNSPHPEHVNSFNLGVLMGPAFMVPHQHVTSSHSPHGVAFAYKASAAYLFKNHIEIGAEVGMTGSYPTFGLDLNYYFPKHIFIGAAGAFKINSKLYEYIGPKVGYDYYYKNNVAIGPEALYLFPLDGKIGVFETLISVKYYF